MMSVKIWDGSHHPWPTVCFFLLSPYGNPRHFPFRHFPQTAWTLGPRLDVSVRHFVCAHRIPTLQARWETLKDQWAAVTPWNNRVSELHPLLFSELDRKLKICKINDLVRKFILMIMNRRFQSSCVCDTYLVNNSTPKADDDKISINRCLILFTG